MGILDAPITLGTQQHRFESKTLRKEPHPWSVTARGAKVVTKFTLSSDISSQYLMLYFCFKLVMLGYQAIVQQLVAVVVN